MTLSIVDERYWGELERLSAATLAQWDGRGEFGGGRWQNNAGETIYGWRALCGFPASRGAWCAVVQCAADVVAAQQLDPHGPQCTPFALSRGAKAYTRNVAAAGRWIYRPRGPFGILGPEKLDEVRAGDRICWHRGDISRRDTWWRGHVGRVVEVMPDRALRVRDGNRNNRRDRNGRYSVVGPRVVKLWERQLYGISRLEALAH